jgi:hypothetical protein
MEEYEADVGDLSENLLTSDEKESTPVITWWN